MIDTTNCNKIIVDTIGKTEKIIEWYQQNKDWVDAEEFRKITVDDLGRAMRLKEMAEADKRVASYLSSR